MQFWPGLGWRSFTCICLHVPSEEIAASVALCVVGSQAAAVNGVLGAVGKGKLLLYTQLHDPADGTFCRGVLEVSAAHRARVLIGMGAWVHLGVGLL